jgi:DNA-directed RNA polymerase
MENSVLADIKINKTKRDRQIQREKQMEQGGFDRYNERREKQKDLSKDNTHHSLIEDALPKVSQGLTQYLEVERAKGSGKPYRWVETLEEIDSDILSFIALKCFMGGVGLGATLTSVATQIGKRVELEVYSSELKEYDKSLHRKSQEIANKNYQTERKRIEAVKKMVHRHSVKAEVPFVPKNLDVCIKAFAEPLINAVLEFSDIFEIQVHFSANRTKKMVGLTPEAIKEINFKDLDAAWLEPMYAPMITPPNDWVSMDTGGYLSGDLSKSVPLVRGACYEQRQHIKHDFAKAKTKGGLPPYVEALNALQRVPLKINTAVLKLVEHCWENGETFGKFPTQYELPIPMRPDDETWEAMVDTEKEALRQKRRNVVKKNQEINGRSVMMEQDLATARELDEETAYYLVWNMCFRGRLYPVSNFSYHRDDHIKALTLLKNGTPVTNETSDWLAIHLANTGDFNKVSKQSFQDRVLWTELNEDLIRSVVADPVAHLSTIQDADKPFQFYAACIEWVGYLDTQQDGEEYICCLPPSLDGSNSGCQHYSALSLNEVDGALVNLVPSDLPSDVYQTVADRVITKLQKIALKSTTEDHLKPRKNAKGVVYMTKEQVRQERLETAQLWLDFGVTRNTVKRNALTYPYSSNQYGFADQITDDLMKPLADKELRGDGKHPFGDRHQQFTATKLFAEVSYESVEEVISSAAEGMQFLQSVSTALAKENKPTHWRSPIDFPVVQKYTKWNTKKVRLYLYDRDAKVKSRAQMSIRREDKFKIDTAKSKAGIAANFVHSLDSAHLANTVLTLADNGINDFMVIHDSFAVGVAHTDLLFEAVRATFVDQYKDVCIYEDIKGSAEQSLDEPANAKFSPIPSKGNLALDRVMVSNYCFS